MKERSLVERDAKSVLRPGTYLEPYALRALGTVREDELLIEQAVDRFDAMGLKWHADQTRRLVAQVREPDSYSEAMWLRN